MAISAHLHNYDIKAIYKIVPIRDRKHNNIIKKDGDSRTSKYKNGGYLSRIKYYIIYGDLRSQQQ